MKAGGIVKNAAGGSAKTVEVWGNFTPPIQAYASEDAFQG